MLAALPADAEGAALVKEIDDCLKFIATPEEIARARAQYADGSDDDIEIDDETQTSPTDEGTWVGAWVFLREES
jgi:hypothetical protein